MIISHKYADISFAISASARGDGRGLFNNNRIYTKAVAASRRERARDDCLNDETGIRDTKKKRKKSYIKF